MIGVAWSSTVSRGAIGVRWDGPVKRRAVPREGTWGVGLGTGQQWAKGPMAVLGVCVIFCTGFGNSGEGFLS